MANLKSQHDPPTQDLGASAPRFVHSAITAEELLKTNTEGLVSLSDYRKRRREAVEFKDHGIGSAAGSGANTPRDGSSTPQPLKKKVKKTKVRLTYDDEEEDSSLSIAPTPRSLSQTPDVQQDDEGEHATLPKKKLGAKVGVGPAPKARTNAALLKQRQEEERMRKEYLDLQELVKKTDIIIPFVFFDGSPTSGGHIRVKKGDQVWLFLDKARKKAAEMGGDKMRNHWARTSIDDLMFVKDELILPHHQSFHWYRLQDKRGHSGLLFDFALDRTAATPSAESVADEEIDPATYNPLVKAKKKKEHVSDIPEDELEGFYDEPGLVKMVDRRWYEKFKHIYPASMWENYDSTKDYSSVRRADAQGNSFFMASTGR